MKRALLIMCLLVSWTAAQSQQRLAYVWGGEQEDAGEAVTIDPDDRAIVGASFYGTANVDPQGSTHLSAKGLTADIALAAVSRDGALDWATVLGGAMTDDHASAIATDDARRIYVGGWFGRRDSAGPIDASFDPVGDSVLPSEGGEDGFLSSYNSDGSFRWSLGLGNLEMNTHERITDIAVSDAGDVFTTGAFHGIVNFRPIGGNPLIRTLPDSKTGTFIARYDSDGTCKWAIEINSGGTDPDVDTWSACALDGQGSLYVAGNFQGNIVSFNPLGAPTTLKSRGATDIFLAKYDVRNGVLKWVLQFGGKAREMITPGGLECDPAGNPTLTGRLSGSGTVDLDPSGGESIVSNTSLFLAKIDPNGQPVFVVGMESGDGDAGTAIGFDSNNNTYLGGYFYGPTQFDPHVDSVTAPQSPTTDAFVAKYDDDGNLAWVNTVGSADASTPISVGALDVDSDDNVVVTGAVSGSSVDLDPGPGAMVSAPIGGSDCFVVKYSTDGKLWEKVESEVNSMTNQRRHQSVRFDRHANALIFDRPATGTRSANAVLHDHAGRQIRAFELSHLSVTLDVSHLASGVYIVRIVPDERANATVERDEFRFVVRR